MKILVLNDDRCYDDNLSSSHGFSLYIEADGKKFLFDVGQDDNFIKNAQKLGVNLDSIECIVLSHGHYDHSRGLQHFDKKLLLICHSDCTIYRRSKNSGLYNGCPYSKEQLSERYNAIFTTKPYEISKNVIFLGEIERKTDFECKEFPSVLEDGSEEKAQDDSGIVLKTSKGLIVISGCGHSGICNLIADAKRVAKEERIFAVMGGFHLKKNNEQTLKTLAYFKDNNVENVYLAHCTSDEVCDYFKENLSTANVDILSTGKEIVFDD